MGVPRSVLLGRVPQPARITEPQFDGDRYHQVPAEALWLREDAEAVFEVHREKALTCPGCGNPRDESMDPEYEGAYNSRALVCHACAVRDRKQKNFTSGPHDPSGLYFTAELNE
jgi:hypothetical protein